MCHRWPQTSIKLRTAAAPAPACATGTSAKCPNAFWCVQVIYDGTAWKRLLVSWFFNCIFAAVFRIPFPSSSTQDCYRWLFRSRCSASSCQAPASGTKVPLNISLRLGIWCVFGRLHCLSNINAFALFTLPAELAWRHLPVTNRHTGTESSYLSFCTSHLAF